MELRHLRYFVAVAEELHFRRAAERLHVAQPAVSEQVRKLEQELGVRLLNRDRRRVELTDAGSALLVEARHVLRQAQVAEQAARGARDRAALRLRVGYVADALPGVVAPALRSIATGTPPIRTTLESGPALSLVEAVREGRLDVAIVGLPMPTAGLRVLTLGVQRAVAALPVDDDRADRPMIDLAQLAPDHVVVLPRAANPAFHDAVVSSLRQAGLSPTLVELAEPQVEHALLAVSCGAGVALLPESVVDRYAAPGIRFFPLTAPRLLLETAVLSRAGAEPGPTAAFLDALTRVGRLRPEPLVSVAA